MFLQHAYTTPIVFAHRGYSSAAPENTMAAFRLAAEKGIPGIELDIHLSADGRLVIIHDHNLKRTTGKDAIVEECSWEELRDLDAGSWFGSSYTGEPLPLLDSVFSEFGTQFFYDIEIKQEGREATGIEEKLAELVRNYQVTDRCIVSSFNPFPLRRFARLCPEIPVAAIYSSHDDVPLLLRHGLGAYITGKAKVIKPHHPKITPLWAWYMFRLRKRIVFPWTVNDQETAKRLIALGVHGLISDDPAPLLPLISQRQ